MFELDASVSDMLILVTSAILAVILMIFAGVAGLNVWPGIGVGVSMSVAAVTFLWGMNRYADWRSLRVPMGLICGLGSWVSVLWVLVGTALGWELPVQLISEWPWGFYGDDREAEMDALRDASIPEDVLKRVPSVEKAMKAAEDPNVDPNSLGESG
jgi:hypothetical protein